MFDAAAATAAVADYAAGCNSNGFSLFFFIWVVCCVWRVHFFANRMMNILVNVISMHLDRNGNSIDLTFTTFLFPWNWWLVRRHIFFHFCKSWEFANKRYIPAVAGRSQCVTSRMLMRIWGGFLHQSRVSLNSLRISFSRSEDRKRQKLICWQALCCVISFITSWHQRKTENINAAISIFECIKASPSLLSSSWLAFIYFRPRHQSHL